MGIKEGEQEAIPDLGFDSRFKYDNVMINDKIRTTTHDETVLINILNFHDS